MAAVLLHCVRRRLVPTVKAQRLLTWRNRKRKLILHFCVPSGMVQTAVKAASSLGLCAMIGQRNDTPPLPSSDRSAYCTVCQQFFLISLSLHVSAGKGKERGNWAGSAFKLLKININPSSKNVICNFFFFCDNLHPPNAPTPQHGGSRTPLSSARLSTARCTVQVDSRIRELLSSLTSTCNGLEKMWAFVCRV